MKRYILEVCYLKVMMTLLTNSSKNFQLSAFHIFKILVANPNKPRDVRNILGKNQEKLLSLLHNLSPGKVGDSSEYQNTISELVNFLDSLLDAALSDPDNEHKENSAFEALPEIYQYIYSPSLDQTLNIRSTYHERSLRARAM
ncbi:unnamed protein product [Lathyrus sativus]|nr:unnamed protein product [Lathyrus sativus]